MDINLAALYLQNNVYKNNLMGSIGFDFKLSQIFLHGGD